MGRQKRREQARGRRYYQKSPILYPEARALRFQCAWQKWPVIFKLLSVTVANQRKLTVDV